MKTILTILIGLTLMSFQPTKIDSSKNAATVVPSDTIYHSGDITLIDKSKKENSWIEILSTPFASALIGVIASMTGFFLADFFTRRNKLREDKNKLLVEFTRVMTASRMLSNQARIKEMWVNFYNACKAKSVYSIPDDQIKKEFERLDNLSYEVLKLTAELNGLRSEFEYKILKKNDDIFTGLILAFHQSTLRFTGMNFNSMSAVELDSIQDKLSDMVRQQTGQQQRSQEDALNAVVDYIKEKIK